MYKSSINLDSIPQITLIGQPSAGRGLTIKRLFNPHSPFEDVDNLFENATLLSFSLNERGKVTILNCMDLRCQNFFNEDIIKLPRQFFEKSDLVLWIINAKDDLKEINESYFSIVIPNNLQDKIIIGINNVESLEPSDWSDEFNLPSQIQD